MTRIGFVSAAVVSPTRTPLQNASICARPARTAGPPHTAGPPRSTRSTVQMKDDLGLKELNDPGNERRFSPGFTTYAERLNGRAAMIGFMIAVAYEVLVPQSGGLVPTLLKLVGMSPPPA